MSHSSQRFETQNCPKLVQSLLQQYRITVDFMGFISKKIMTPV